MRLLLLLLLALSAGSFCAAQTVTYTESSAEIQNPDRGFYQPINGIASSFTPLTAAQLTDLRTNPFTPWQGNYTVSPTIIFRHYVLDSFTSSALSAAFLSGVQADFDAARAAGVRLLLRFSYTITPPTGPCSSGVCPPYGDAPKAVVLAHIAQLRPYLRGNSDVILAVQNGFIGVWGEQYYSDYFGDASTQGKLTDQNWQDRLDVLRALLEAVPANRMVQVRYPQLKQKFIYGINAPVTSPALSAAQANNGTASARIGFHNDCFLSAPDDQGTFWDYGTSATSASDQTAVLKPYWADDSQYVSVGGETCNDAFSPQNDCAGQAVTDMDLLNYSYLNSDYNNTVNNDWQTDGCMPTIKQRLGYRLVLRTGTFPTTGTAGSSLAFTLDVENVGFAAPFNPRALHLILRNTSTAQVFAPVLTGPNTDSRFWVSNQPVTLNPTVALPADMPPGTYELLLQLRDTSNANAVATRPEYSVQFANTGTWEPTTGFNQLNQTVAVTASPLPVQLVSFTATALGSTQVRLGWATASEQHSAYFEAERSLDGKVFAAVGRVAAAGNSATARSYSLADTGWPAGTTTLYYRLRQVDQDGIFTYSPVRVVTLPTTPPLVLFPNPAPHRATLTGAAAGAPIQVLDALGRLVLRATADATGTAQLTLPAGLPSGMYVVRTDSQALRLSVE